MKSRNESILCEGDLVQITLIDDRARRNNRVHNQKILSINLTKGKYTNTHLGKIYHTDMIGGINGSFYVTSEDAKYLAITPRLSDAMLSMPRGSAVIYPKDAGAILVYGDIAPGSKVLECGLGSGVMTLALLRAVGNEGSVKSVERRDDFAKTAIANLKRVNYGELPKNWSLELTDFNIFLNAQSILRESGGFSEYITYDKVVLDMLNPWDYLDRIYELMHFGGVLTCYITNVLQISQLTNYFLDHKDKWGNVECFEMIRRSWMLSQESIRPKHQGIMHSGFLMFARKINGDK